MYGVFSLSYYLQPANTSENCFDYAFFFGGISPQVIMKALDKFYEDYRNTHVKILDAIRVCSLDIKGNPPETIEWWTRYYRSDDITKKSLLNELKNNK